MRVGRGCDKGVSLVSGKRMANLCEYYHYSSSTINDHDASLESVACASASTRSYYMS